MPAEQLANLLKNTPVSSVEKVEVVYSAPAKYRVRGAVINLVLKERKPEEPFLRGEVGADFTKARYAQGNGRMSLSEYARRHELPQWLCQSGGKSRPAPLDGLYRRPDLHPEKQIHLQPVLYSCKGLVRSVGLPKPRRTDDDLSDGELRLRAELRSFGDTALYGRQHLELPPPAGRLLFQGCLSGLSHHRFR